LIKPNGSFIQIDTISGERKNLTVYSPPGIIGKVDRRAKKVWNSGKNIFKLPPLEKSLPRVVLL
jgi:hypothetical protein